MLTILYLQGDFMNDTGCIFCPIGCHLDNRFQQLHKTHPKLWEYVMNQLHLKEFLDYVGEQRGKKISYY